MNSGNSWLKNKNNENFKNMICEKYLLTSDLRQLALKSLMRYFPLMPFGSSSPFLPGLQLPVRAAEQP
ncbi:hypothetical protein HPG69_009718, partial [Diceros bicornis minor]